MTGRRVSRLSTLIGQLVPQRHSIRFGDFLPIGGQFLASLERSRSSRRFEGDPEGAEVPQLEATADISGFRDGAEDVRLFRRACLERPSDAVALTLLVAVGDGREARVRYGRERQVSKPGEGQSKAGVVFVLATMLAVSAAIASLSRWLSSLAKRTAAGRGLAAMPGWSDESGAGPDQSTSPGARQAEALGRRSPPGARPR